MIADTGYWDVDFDRVNGEPCDNGLMDALIKFCFNRVATVYDFGCGAGKYVKGFNDAGIAAIGFDGNPITGMFENCHVADLSKNIKTHPEDLVLSLEVGEHIPAEYESVFINNLVKSTNRFLILSWAIPGQGGYGHVNEKTNEQVIRLVGMRYNKHLTDYFRGAAEVWWFKNSLMVFEK